MSQHEMKTQRGAGRRCKMRATRGVANWRLIGTGMRGKEAMQHRRGYYDAGSGIELTPNRNYCRVFRIIRGSAVQLLRPLDALRYSRCRWQRSLPLERTGFSRWITVSFLSHTKTIAKASASPLHTPPSVIDAALGIATRASSLFRAILVSPLSVPLVIKAMGLSLITS